ncbi:MAG TPA: exosortase-associated EpsI family protein [Verrucomicrobiae bacterium]|nr:exosortase-associated EpsI family protein [Verrucomicrobiae bacterium]
MVVGALVAALWLFPRFWYARSDAQTGRYWLSCQTNLPGWTSHSIPVGKTAEAILAADELNSAELVSPAGALVRVFSAKRYAESGSEIGLFAHTPDRCWVEAGWKLEPAVPEVVELTVHGVPIKFERRVFAHQQQRELVYFAGLVGGQPLPYRLDHNLSVGARLGRKEAADKTGATLRATDTLFWRRVWDSFASRRALIGPKQFVRISTPVNSSNPQEADNLLQGVLPSLLALTDYAGEIRQHTQMARSN